LQRQRDLVALVDGDRALKSGPKNLFRLLVEAAGEIGCCYWSNAKLASRLAVKAPRTIRAWLATLERTGWIVRRDLEQGIELPGQHGEAVENTDGMRLIVVRGLWTGGSMPGVPYDHRPPAQRNRGCRASQRSSGEDRVNTRQVSANPGGEDRLDLRKEVKLQREGIDPVEEGAPLLAPSELSSDTSLGCSSRADSGEVREHANIPGNDDGVETQAWKDAVEALHAARISTRAAETRLGCYLRDATASRILAVVADRRVGGDEDRVTP
jgi:hypothetical protein